MNYTIAKPHTPERVLARLGAWIDWEEEKLKVQWEEIEEARKASGSDALTGDDLSYHVTCGRLAAYRHALLTIKEELL